MTLWAPNPWGQVVDGQAAELARRIGFAHPDLEDVAVAAVGRSVWIAGPALADPADAAYRIAGVVAHLWPGWLAELGVSCVVTSGSYRVTAPPSAMVALEAGPDRAAWLAAVS